MKKEELIKKVETLEKENKKLHETLEIQKGWVHIDTHEHKRLQERSNKSFELEKENEMLKKKEFEYLKTINELAAALAKLVK